MKGDDRQLMHLRAQAEPRLEYHGLCRKIAMQQQSLHPLAEQLLLLSVPVAGSEAQALGLCWLSFRALAQAVQVLDQRLPRPGDMNAGQLGCALYFSG